MLRWRLGTCWRPGTWPKATQLWAKLFGFSAAAHLGFLFIIFFIYRGDSLLHIIDVSRTMIQTDAPVVFMPFQKNVAQAQVPAKKKEAESSIPVSRAKKTKSELKKRKLAEKAATSLAPAQKKPAKKKKNKKEKVLKQPPQEIIAKPEPKEPEKKAESNQQEEIAQYMGQHDLDALQLHEYITTEVGKYWKPPTGMAKECACEVKLLVDWQGKLANMTMQKTSGVLAYDVSVRAAVLAMNFPQWLWGKEFLITFKQ